LTRERERVTKSRAKLPWLKVDKEYVFFQAGGGCASLSELFQGRSQLIVYHFMFGSDWEEGCASCSFLADGFDGIISHLKARDVSLAVVSAAHQDKLLAYKRKMDWQFPWYSCGDSTFNRDFDVIFDNDGGIDWKEIPCISVFYKGQDGAIYYTYGTFARGLENLISTYDFLDLVPKGRDEEKLHEPMEWVKRRHEYDYTT